MLDYCLTTHENRRFFSFGFLGSLESRLPRALRCWTVDAWHLILHARFLSVDARLLSYNSWESTLLFSQLFTSFTTLMSRSQHALRCWTVDSCLFMLEMVDFCLITHESRCFFSLGSQLLTLFLTLRSCACLATLDYRRWTPVVLRKSLERWCLTLVSQLTRVEAFFSAILTLDSFFGSESLDFWLVLVDTFLSSARLFFLSTHDSCISTFEITSTNDAWLFSLNSSLFRTTCYLDSSFSNCLSTCFLVLASWEPGDRSALSLNLRLVTLDFESRRLAHVICFLKVDSSISICLSTQLSTLYSFRQSTFDAPVKSQPSPLDQTVDSRPLDCRSYLSRNHRK